MKRLFYIAVISCLFACEKQIPLNEFEFNEKLVLNSFNGYKDVVDINLSQSVNVLDVPKFGDMFGEADIIWYPRNGVVKDTTLAVIEGNCKFFTPLDLGETYTLRVTMDDNPVIFATDKMPDYLPEVKVDTGYNQGDSYKFRLTVKDHAVKEFYLLKVSVVGLQVVGQDSSEAEYPVSFNSADRIFVTNISTVANQNDFALFSDELINGFSRQLEFSVNREEFEHPNFKKDRIRVVLQSISENMFNYYFSLLENNHIYGGPLATTAEDAGNVNNGLGIFCFYADSADTYTIPQ